MKNGETIRFECNTCLTEFEVCREPKVKQQTNKEEAGVAFCPFCGNPAPEEV